MDDVMHGVLGAVCWMSALIVVTSCCLYWSLACLMNASTHTMHTHIRFTHILWQWKLMHWFMLRVSMCSPLMLCCLLLDLLCNQVGLRSFVFVRLIHFFGRFKCVSVWVLCVCVNIVNWSIKLVVMIIYHNATDNNIRLSRWYFRNTKWKIEWQKYSIWHFTSNIFVWSLVFFCKYSQIIFTKF